MQIFVDESGDPGFLIEGGSSRFFVVAVVIFDDENQANLTRAALEDLGRRWSKPKKFELKFSKLSEAERVEALHVAAKFSFKIRSVIFDKVRMNELQLQHFKKNYYQYAIRSLLDRPDYNLTNSVLKIDTFGEDAYRQGLVDYFTKHICNPDDQTICQLVFQDSKYDILIQLADLVAGALRKSFEITHDDSQIYREVISDHEEDIKVFHSVLHTRKLG